MTFFDSAALDEIATRETSQAGALRGSLDRYTQEAIEQAFQCAFHMTGATEYLEYYESH